MTFHITDKWRLSFQVVLCLAAASVFESAIAAEHAGDLDTRFGTGGIVGLPITDLAPNCTEHVVVDADNRAVLAYNTMSGGAISALSTSGTIDPTFGSAGSIALAQTLCDMKIDSKNRLLALTEDSVGFELSRFSSDGKLDTTFGVGGYVDIRSPAGNIDGVAMQMTEDGGIVVLGTDYSFSGQYKMLAAKIDSDGSLDTTFGGHGLLTVSVALSGMESTLPRAIAIDSKGFIYLDGYTLRDDDALVSSVAKLTPDGKMDTTFGGGNGYIQTDVFPPAGMFRYTSPYSILVDTHDRVVVSGSASSPSQPQFFVARYLSDGSPDASFSGGVVQVPVPGSLETDAGHTLLDARERIILTGTGVAPSYDSYLAAARLNDDGTLDTSFASGGTELLATSAWNGYSALTHDQNILVFGDAPGGESIMLDKLINNPSMIVMPPPGF
ncbi:MAG TPA: hypothetical protein VH082_03500 [Rudaea sp.]|jgi:uncharacterized delta-60 repeat protein|nr:hypothetical protein [Rudaea sp.]